MKTLLRRHVMLCTALMISIGAAAASSQPLPTPESVPDSCLFGRMDDFVIAEVELPEPSTSLRNAMAGHTSQPLLAFDQCTVNRYFAHTMKVCDS